MSKQQEALRLALDALEGLEALLLSMGLTHLIVYGDAEKAITALRQALANEALDKMAENAREIGLDYEPVANYCQECLTYNGHQEGCSQALAEQPAQQEPDWLNKEQTETDWDHVWLLIKAASYASSKGFVSGTTNWGSAVSRYMRNESPQPAQQEPVAWTVAGPVTNWSKDFSAYRTQHYVRPVYTRPQARETEQPAQKEPDLSMREPSVIRDRLIQAGWIPPAQQPAQTDWEAVAADQAMTIAMLKSEQPAQQEPVAWRWLYDGKPDSEKHFPMPAPNADIVAMAAANKFPHTVQFLYTHPQAREPLTFDGMTAQEFALKELYAFQEATGCDTADQIKSREPLTDEQIDQLLPEIVNGGTFTVITYGRAVARAIEAAHGIGEKK